MIVQPGSTDVTTYFVLRKAADGTELTGATITGIDLVYTQSGADRADKVDATALATPDAAHSDGKAIEVDATSSPGLYRVDWPDAAFAGTAREVILSVIYATAFTEHLRVELIDLTTDTTGGSGGITYTRTETDADTGLPVDDILIEAYTDSGGIEFVTSERTNAFGKAYFRLESGTYYLFRSKSGRSFVNPVTIVVS